MQRESQVVEIAYEDIVLEQEIGRGTFAKVYRGKCRGQQVAIKVPFSQNFDDDTLRDFREEIAVMSQIHHPNLVLFMGACTIPGKLMIVTELMPRNLENLFIIHPQSSKPNRRPTFVHKLKMAKDAALGMNWLHKSKPMFIHRDFKLSNLLVDENYNVKVCDFGLAKMKQANDHVVGQKGSPLYMAPEVFEGSYSEKCDVYSFGLSFWEIINERRVFPRYENNLPALLKAKKNYETPPVTDDMLPRLAKLLTRCWDKDPAQRPAFDEIVRELDEIIIEECITDDKGREMWKKYCKGEDKMMWDDFARSVCVSVGKISLPENYRSDRQMQCLKVLLCKQSEPNTVHAEKFGKVLAWFGPLVDERTDSPQQRPRTFLDRIEEVLGEKWFHGELSTPEAEERLNSRKPGTFLLRFSSSEKGAFTLSGLEKDRTKSHQRIMYHANRGIYVLPDGTYYDTLFEAVKDLCNASKFRMPCPGSRYARYFNDDSPQLATKNIAMVKEEIKHLQLLLLNELCDPPTRTAAMQDQTIDVVTEVKTWSQSSALGSGIHRGLYNTGSSIHSSGGAWARNTSSEVATDNIRIAPYIPPELAEKRHASSSSSSQSTFARPQPTSSFLQNKNRPIHKQPYSQSSDLFHSAPLSSMKNAATVSTPYSPFAANKSGPTRTSDLLSAPLREEKKKGGFLSRLRRGVSSSSSKEDKTGASIGLGGDFGESNHSSGGILSSGFLSGPLKSAKLGSSKRKNSKKEKKSSLGKKHATSRDRDQTDAYSYGRDHHTSGLPSDDEGSNWAHDASHLAPYSSVPSKADSTTASTNSIPAHVLYTMQKVEDEKAQKRRQGNYDSDSSTEDLYPPCQLGTSSSLSASSAYIKHVSEERARNSHLIGGKEMEEQEEADAHDDLSDTESTSSDDEGEYSAPRKGKDSRPTEDEEEQRERDKKKRSQKSKGKSKLDESDKKKRTAKESSHVSGSRSTSRASTTPSHLMETVRFAVPRPGQWPEAPPSPHSRRAETKAPTEEKATIRLDQLPSTLTTSKAQAEGSSPTSTLNGSSPPRKPKKSKQPNTPGDGTERSGEHKKKHKKDSGKTDREAVKERKKSDGAGQRRASPVAAADAAEEESGRQQEQTTNPQGKKKKKTDERTVIAVF